MRIEAMVPAAPSLVRAYADGSPEVIEEFFEAPFASEDSFRRAAERRAAAWRGSSGRRRLASICRAIAPAGPRAARLLREVRDQGGFFVTAGQQPGLLGGPLFTLYKALHACSLAKAASRALGRPAMPVFWVASDDHDWAEVNQAHVLQGLGVARLALPERLGAARRRMGGIRLEDEGVQLTVELARILPENEFRDEFLELAKRAYAPGETISSAFQLLMSGLLKETDIGFLDPARPEARRAMRAALEREAASPEPSRRALEEVADRLRKRGYGVQSELLEGATNLMVESTAGRERLYRDEGGYVLPKAGQRVTGEEIAELIAKEDGTVTPNVLLRPIVESAMLPSVATVAGPGEIAYHAQLRALFRRHDTPMPIVVPRISRIVVEPVAARAMEKRGIGISDLRDPDRLIALMAREEMPREIEEGLEDWRGAAQRAAEKLETALPLVDPTLKGALATARNASLAQAAKFERKVLQALRRRSKVLSRQIRTASSSLWPSGRAQERTLSALYYYVRYGPEFTKSVRNTINGRLKRPAAGAAP